MKQNSVLIRLINRNAIQPVNLYWFCRLFRRGGFQPSLNVASMELYIQKITFGFVQKYQHLQNLQGLGRVKTLPYGNVVTTLQTEIWNFPPYSPQYGYRNILYFFDFNRKNCTIAVKTDQNFYGFSDFWRVNWDYDILIYVVI